MNPSTLGIDVSKATLHLALMKGSACLESTSIYGQAVARYLYDQGHCVSVVNPARISGFAQSELRRTKTDGADSATIARFWAFSNQDSRLSQNF
jgi:transposase